MGKATNPRAKGRVRGGRPVKDKAIPMTLAEQREQDQRRERQAQERKRRIEGNRALEVQGAKVVLDTDGKIAAAQRFDCFSSLLRDRAREAQAVAWLEELIRTAEGENGRERRPDFIRASSEGAPGQNVTGDMIDAGETLAVVVESLRPWELRLLFELLRPDAALENETVDSPANWRQVTARITGATTPQRQGERVCVACESLVWVKENIERLERSRKMRRDLAA